MQAVIDNFKKWWLAHLSVIVWVIWFLDPSVKAYLVAHPNLGATVGVLWMSILLLAKSPIAPATAPPAAKN